MLNVFNIRTAGDLRAFLYVLWPVVATFLVSLGVTDQNEASLWGGLVFALLGPVIAFYNVRNVSTFRAAFYAVLGAVQAITIAYGLIQAADVAQWLPFITAIVGLLTGGVASANTQTSGSPVT